MTGGHRWHGVLAEDHHLLCSDLLQKRTDSKAPQLLSNCDCDNLINQGANDLLGTYDQGGGTLRSSTVNKMMSSKMSQYSYGALQLAFTREFDLRRYKTDFEFRS
jgi:hypothetical protein